ncbi:MAG: CoA transferase [Alphaproteobacteria bacterium]|nr:CoA transferase [Alphaproteobacteria bacterium]
MKTPHEILHDLWALTGGEPAALAAVDLVGAEPALPSSFRVGAAAQAAIAAAALAAADFDALRTGRRQRIGVDMRHAAAEFRSERYLRVGGAPAPELWDRIAGVYRCGDGGWVRLHTNFPHHRDGVLALLGCAHAREAVAAALQGWCAAAFEEAAAERGLVVAMLRDVAHWDATPQAAAIARQPLVAIERIGDAPPGMPGDSRAARPLSGIRVLDLTRIIAGPVCGRTLAAHGADVLLVTSPHLPAVAPLVIDTGRGKRTTTLHLRDPADADRLRALVREADVFVQGYRPGGVAALGFGPGALAALRPGIVCVSLSAYGDAGPWTGRRGFDSLVQTASGFNAEEAAAAGSDTPKPLPCQALDHATGYLLALGALAALRRRATEGGSWHVHASLARTGLWLRRLGRLDRGLETSDPDLDAVRDLLEETPSGFGLLTAVRHAARLSATPAHWALPAMPLGSHPAAWLERPFD